MSMRKDEISFDKIASIFSGLSTKEYFMAITTVARVKAAGLVVLSYIKSILDVRLCFHKNINYKKYCSLNIKDEQLYFFIPSVPEQAFQVQ